MIWQHFFLSGKFQITAMPEGLPGELEGVRCAICEITM